MVLFAVIAFALIAAGVVIERMADTISSHVDYVNEKRYDYR